MSGHEQDHERDIVIPLTVGRLRELVDEAYTRCGYRLIDFGRGEGKGVLNAPKKLVMVVNTLQALLHNEIATPLFDTNDTNDAGDGEGRTT